MTLSVPRALSWVGGIVAALVLFVLVFETHGSGGYTVYARVSDASDLLPNNFVKIDGIEAGTIKSIYLNKAENMATVKMVLDRDAAPIGAGASAAIRPVNLLGEKYLDLNPGDLRRPLPSGAIIPEGRVTTPVELDDVLNTLDPTTLTALQVVIDEAGISMAGRGTDFMRTLHELPPTLDAARQVVGAVAQQNAALRTAIVDGNQVLASVDSRRTDLQHLISTGSQALGAIDASRTNLGTTLGTAPAALSALDTALVSLRTAAGTLTPAAAQLQRATPALAATLERLPAFTGDAGSTLQEARAVAPAIDRLATQSLPTLMRLRPTAAALSGFATTLKPLLTALDQGRGLNELLGFTNGWANVTQGGDPLGHVFNLNFSLDPESLQNVVANYRQILGLGAPTKHPVRHPERPSRPAVGTVASTVAGATKGLGGTLASGVAKALGGVAGTVAGVTGALPGVAQGLGGALAPAGHHGPGGGPSTTTTGTTTNSTAALLHYLLGR